HVGLVVRLGRWIPPTFYPCPAQPEHLMQHARFKRLATSLGKPTPSTNRASNPARSTGASTNSKMPSMVPSFFSCLLFLPQPLPLRNHVGFQITPEINHQSSGHRYNSDPPHPGTSTCEALLVPLAQFAVRLQA